MQHRDVSSSATVRAEEAGTPAAGGTDPWRLVRTDHDPTRAAHHESLFALANGTLGVRGGLEEAPSPSQGSFLTGVWERTPIEYHERFPGFARHTDTRLPVADGTRIALWLDGQPVDLAAGEWLDFEQALDLRAGALNRRLRWRSPAGATVQVEAERIVPWRAPGLLCIRYRVRSLDYRGPLALDSVLAADNAAAGQGDDPRIGARVDGGLSLTGASADAAAASVCQSTRRSGIRLACTQRHRLPGAALAFEAADTDAHGARQRYVATLAPGDCATLEKYVAYAWSEPGEDIAETVLLDAAAATLAQALEQSFDRHLERQAEACAAFWRAADLAIDGDPAAELALRVNLFHLRQSTAPDGRGSAAAKSLTGEGYEGHYFWDAEAFVLPALACLAPELARGMLEYRVRMLERARAHAREMNHARGALYPWRTIGGDECSAYFPSGSAQYHINAAIAFALRLYVDATGDTGLLLDGGAEMLVETARLWLEAGHYSPRQGGAFCIRQVTGPDEYTALVDNNHYTNRMAQRHLRHAAATADWLAREHPADWAALAARIALGGDEVDAWRRAADAMYLPVDARLQVFPQDDTFLDKPRLPDALRDATRHGPLLLRLHPLTIYRHQVCKQADVLQAFVLAGDYADRAAKRRNFDYYEGVTVHDSTLSASTFGIVAAEVGHADKAWRYFREALRVDLDDLHGNTAHGVHLAAMGGSWMGLAWGFGGLRCHDGTLAFAPTLPAAWRGYRFGLRWRGRQLRVAVHAGCAEYTLLDGEPLAIRHHGRALTLHAGRPAVLPLSGRTRFPQPFKAVVFDLDGVLADTATVHHAAWKKLADEIGLPFDDAVGERLKGVDRRASLEILLERSPRVYTEAEKEALAARKNAYYREQIERFGPGHLLPGARAAVESVRRAGLKTALASASRNAPLLLERLGIAGLFDYVVDAGRIARAKPDPEIFLAAAAGLGLTPADCLGVEDAAAGVAAIHAAGMAAVGIGSGPALAEADRQLPDIAAFDIGQFATSA
ncbi:beta-phosphoglucomutase [Fulvimonas sp. R45]|uniref:beta-phosphoglucomutase n=1 Tax=Fulvimonas sp. R45 TaxID=3045937 RepID=UPI00265E3E30|nr:beta-phosphoglucomutase [Fulvimonas sp. R45]MDO1527729.1 beta-phosphoglucomutase [Fulvimonas sp. R45]